MSALGAGCGALSSVGEVGRLWLVDRTSHVHRERRGGGREGVREREGARERERAWPDRDRETERDRERQRQTQRETERHTETEKGRGRERKGGGGGEGTVHIQGGRGVVVVVEN